MEAYIEQIPGAKALSDWFGVWPGFHDAEVLECSLKSEGSSLLSLRTWLIGKTVDEKGFLLREKPVKVDFHLRKLQEVNLFDFHLPGVIFGLHVSIEEGKYRIQLDPCYGLAGNLLVEELEIKFESIVL